jgi:hypothetical protein
MDFASEPLKLSAAWNGLQDGEDVHTLQEAYLGRLRRLLNLRSTHHEDLNDQGLWLLDRSIFTTYCDCMELGAGFVAQNMIRRVSSKEGRQAHAALGNIGDPARWRRQ